MRINPTIGGVNWMIEEERQPYDKSSKWLIQHHGDSMLRLAAIDNIAAWRPAQAEVVQPRRLPDGLLEVRLKGESQDDLFLIEVATYPERRVAQQLTDDLMLVYLDQGELPEAVAFVLRPKGKYRVPQGRDLRSRHGLSACRLKWRVVELWKIPAEQLLAVGDVGLIPWVPLTEFDDPPERMVRRCREVIEERAPAGEKENLLAVTQVLTYLRYNDFGLLAILGGKKLMLEVPWLDEIVQEKFEIVLAEKTREATQETARATVRQNILSILDARFGEVPQRLAEQIGSIEDQDQLNALVRSAATSRDLKSFRRTVPRS